MDALEERKAYWMKRREEAKAKGEDGGSEDGGEGPSSAATGAPLRPNLVASPKYQHLLEEEDDFIIRIYNATTMLPTLLNAAKHFALPLRQSDATGTQMHCIMLVSLLERAERHADY